MMIIRRITFIVFIFLVFLASVYFLTRQRAISNGIYEIDPVEVRKLLGDKIQPGSLEILFIKPNTNPRKVRFNWPSDPDTELLSVSFTKSGDSLQMLFYLDDNYTEVIKQDPKGALEFINTGIIYGFIETQLDPRSNTVKTFCDTNCELSSFSTVESVE